MEGYYLAALNYQVQQHSPRRFVWTRISYSAIIEVNTTLAWHCSPNLLILYFHNHLYLDAGTVGTRAFFKAHRRPCVAPALSIKFSQEVSGADGNPRLVAEPGCGVDHAQEFDYADYLVQIPYL